MCLYASIKGFWALTISTSFVKLAKYYIWVIIVDPAMAKKNYNRIKVVLAEKGMTNIELAKNLDKNQQTVTRWCTNDSQPSVEPLFQVAQVLGVKAKDLLND